MRVLMFGWEFPPHIAGGLGTACYGMTRGLAHCGVDVLFVMPKASGDEDHSFVNILSASEVDMPDVRLTKVQMDELFAKVSFLRVNSNLVPYLSAEEYDVLANEELSSRSHCRESRDLWRRRYDFSGKYGANLMDEVANYAMVAAAIALQHKDEFDIIHAHDWLTYYAGIAAKRVSGKPLVVHVHATEYDRSGSDNINRQTFEIEREGMLEADRVLTVSNLTRNIVIEKYGISPDKVTTVHNAVSFDAAERDTHHTNPTGDKIVTFLGRVTYQKGPDFFVDAAVKVLRRMPNVRFVMAGSGDMLNHIVRRVAKMGVADRFHFAGFLKSDEVARMFSESDVYVMPSVSEPFGISPLEAMREGVPVIISKQSGVAEVLDYAMKVDYWDVDAMSDAIYALLNYPALSHLFVGNGGDEVAKIEWNSVAKKIKQIYEDVVRQCATMPPNR